MQRRRFSTIAAVLLAPLLSSQQNAFIPRTVETIDVSIVNVELFVTDKHGQRVRGLTPDDFDVFENGVRQKVTNFTEYSGGDAVVPKAAPGAPAAPAATAAAVAEPSQSQKRTVIVFVEHFQLSQKRSEPMFDALKASLHKMVRPGDAAIIVWYDRGEVVTRQRFTDDLAAIDRALDQIQKDAGGAFIDDFRIAARDADQIEIFTKEAQQVAEAALKIKLPSDSDPRYAARSLARMQATEAVYDQQRKMEAMKALMRAVSADDGKKLMLMATRRLSAKAGAEFFYAADNAPFAMHEANVAFDMSRDIRSFYETANANAVTIYPIYAEGNIEPESIEAGNTATDRINATGGPIGHIDETKVTTMLSPGQIKQLIIDNEKNALEQIAAHTGGMMASGPSDIAGLMPRVEDDLQWYYSLAYRTSPTLESRARNIVVKAKNPDYTVRSRREYVAKSDVTRMEDRVISALFRPSDQAPFHIAVNVGQRRSRGKQMIIPVSIRIPIMKLTPLPEDSEYTGAFSVYTAWGTRLRGISQTSHETKQYSIPADQLTRARKSYYTYTIELMTDPSTDRVAFGVLDEISKDYALKVVDLAEKPRGTH
jgi:VWFA-related protein